MSNFEMPYPYFISSNTYEYDFSLDKTSIVICIDVLDIGYHFNIINNKVDWEKNQEGNSLLPDDVKEYTNDLYKTIFCIRFLFIMYGIYNDNNNDYEFFVYKMDIYIGCLNENLNFSQFVFPIIDNKVVWHNNLKLLNMLSNDLIEYINIFMRKNRALAVFL